MEEESEGKMNERSTAHAQTHGRTDLTMCLCTNVRTQQHTIALTHKTGSANCYYNNSTSILFPVGFRNGASIYPESLVLN